MVRNTILLNSNGTKNVLIIAGVHGNEVTPMKSQAMIYKLINDGYMKCSEIIKEIRFIFMENQNAIRNCTREFTSNLSGDMNRSFSHAGFENFNSDVALIKECILTSDYVIDLHSSENINEFMLIDNNYMLPHLVEWCNENDVRYACRNFDGNTIKNYTNEFYDKLGFTIELNGLNYSDHDSASEGMLIIQKILTNLPSIPDKNKYDKISNYPMISDVISNISGFIDLTGIKNINKNLIIKAGEKIRILDCYYDPIREIELEFDSFIIQKPLKEYVIAGETIITLQPVIKIEKGKEE